MYILFGCHALHSHFYILVVICLIVLLWLQDKILEVKREIRKSDWEKFQNEMKAKCSNVDSTFDTKEKELNIFYIELEKKLHLEDAGFV